MTTTFRRARRSRAVGRAFLVLATIGTMSGAAGLIAAPGADGLRLVVYVDSPSELRIVERDDSTVTLTYRNGTTERHLFCTARVTGAGWIRGLRDAAFGAAARSDDVHEASESYITAHPLPADAVDVSLAVPAPGTAVSESVPYAATRPAGAYTWCNDPGGEFEIEFALPPEPTGSLDLGSLTGSLESGSLASLGTGTTSGS